MPGGLVALLDDIAALAKLAAASIDDVGVAAGKAGTKAAGVVVDDTAVTPKYVTGLSPDRELPIIWKITKGSLRNKLLFLLPAAIALSALAPWAIRARARLRRAGIATNDALFGLYETGRLTETVWLALVPRLGSGVTEVYCHPSTGSAELAALLSPAVGAALERAGVRRVPFADAAR